ncbi:MAG: cytochrome o ubiquinol oxidase subunit IV [uncultured bacterium]|nr:MAG: cytochrome o ubiquinol oxidase subunit IV [uncultured bacterium]
MTDYGTGEKKLSTYVWGMLGCIALTIAAFWVVMAHLLPRGQTILFIYAAACLQLIVQLICFLRLNVQTVQGRMNVMIFLFVSLILLCIVFGSLWIMWNLHYNMMG